MANRTPVDFNLGRARIQPVASPVDTYSRPTASGLSQLAESLKQVAPEVAKYSDVAMQQQNDTQKAAGEQKARELFESGVSYKDAIKKGLIAPSESPWFQLGAKEQFGRVTAGRFSTDLQNAVANNPALQDSVDVEQYDKFAADYKKQWLADNVGDENRGLNFEHGFGSMADAYSEDSRRQFVAQAGGRLVKQVGDRHYTEVFQMLDHETSMHTDPTAMAQAWNLINDRAIASGMDPRTANLAGVKALGDLVMRDGDVGLFDILKKVKTGSGNLYSTQWAQEEIQKVSHQVWEDKQAHHNADARAAEEAKQAHSDSEAGDIVSQWASSSNPSRLDFSKRIDALAKTDWKTAAELRRTQNVFAEGAFASDVNAKQGALANIFKPVGDKDYVDVHTLVGLLNTRQINAQDFITLKSQIDDRDNAIRREKEDGRSHNPYTDPQFTHSLTSLTQQISNGRPDEMWGPDVTRRANGAQAEFGKAWLEYVAGAGKDASYLDKNKFLEETLLAITAKWQPPLTKQGASQPGVPQVDLRTPGQRDDMRRMANLIDSQVRNNTGFSPGTLTFMRANGITDVSAFVKQYADHE